MIPFVAYIAGSQQTPNTFQWAGQLPKFLFSVEEPRHQSNIWFLGPQESVPNRHPDRFLQCLQTWPTVNHDCKQTFPYRTTAKQFPWFKWLNGNTAFTPLCTLTIIAWVRVSATFVCLFFHTTSQKPTQLGLAKLIKNYVLEAHLFWASKIKDQGYEAQNTVPAWVVALLWVLAFSSWPSVVSTQANCRQNYPR